MGIEIGVFVSTDISVAPFGRSLAKLACRCAALQDVATEAALGQEVYVTLVGSWFGEAVDRRQHFIFAVHYKLRKVACIHAMAVIFTRVLQ